MRYSRTYFDKDNTIVKGFTINLGASPVSELFYGGDIADPIYSRYIFHFDETPLKEAFENCELGDLTKTVHTLKFKPTFFFGDNIERCFASDYTVCLFPLSQEWNEGCGSTYGCEGECDSIYKSNCAPSDSASNWFNATTMTEWTTEGVFNPVTGDTVYIECKSVGCGQDCDFLEFDVTHYVNDMLSGGTVNYGFGLAFHGNFELFPDGKTKSLGIYSRHTTTFYEPFLETEYDEVICDSRANFIAGHENKLYLITRKNGTNITLDEMPLVSILDDDDNVVFQTSGHCVSKGIYCANITITGDTEDCTGMYVDRWENLTYLGKEIGYVDQQFEIKPETSAFDFDGDIGGDMKFGYRARGINRGERIKSGDVRRVFIDVYEQYNPQKRITPESIYFRLYKKEGCNEHNILDWRLMDTLKCDHFIDIDTHWMIKGEYFVDFKTILGGIERTYAEEVHFTVLNEKCC